MFLTDEDSLDDEDDGGWDSLKESSKTGSIRTISTLKAVVDDSQALKSPEKDNSVVNLEKVN